MFINKINRVHSEMIVRIRAAESWLKNVKVKKNVGDKPNSGRSINFDTSLVITEAHRTIIKEGLRLLVASISSFKENE